MSTAEVNPLIYPTRQIAAAIVSNPVLSELYRKKYTRWVRAGWRFRRVNDFNAMALEIGTDAVILALQTDAASAASWGQIIEQANKRIKEGGTAK